LALQNYHGAFKVLPPGAYLTEVNRKHNAWGWRAKLLPFMEQQALYDMIDWEDEEYCWDSHLPPGHAGEHLLSFAYCPSEEFAGIPSTWSEDGIDYTTTHYLSNYMGVSGRGVYNERQEIFEPYGWYPKDADGTFFEGSKVSFKHITDGTSNTFVVGERGLQENNPWGYGICAGGEKDGYLCTAEGLIPGGRGPAHESHFWSHHPGGVQFLKADGSGHFISADINLFTLLALSTIAGDQIMSKPPGFKPQRQRNRSQAAKGRYESCRPFGDTEYGIAGRTEPIH
jgi:hypothetical protein